MRAISDALYFNPHHHTQISTMIVQFLKKIIASNVNDLNRKKDFVGSA